MDIDQIHDENKLVDAQLIKEIGQEIGSVVAREVVKELGAKTVPSFGGQQLGEKEKIRIKETYVSPFNQAEEELDHNFDELEIKSQRSSAEDLDKTIKTLQSQR